MLHFIFTNDNMIRSSSLHVISNTDIDIHVHVVLSVFPCIVLDKSVLFTASTAGQCWCK